MTQTVTKDGVTILVDLPEREKKESRHLQPSYVKACQGDEGMASILDYFTYAASREIKDKGLSKDCKVVTLTRTHDAILDKLENAPSEKSLIRYLQKLKGCKFVLSEKYKRDFEIHLDTIQEAVNNPPPPKIRKPRQKGCKVEPLTRVQPSEEESEKVVRLQQKVDMLQLKVEQLQPKVDMLQRYNPVFERLAALLEGTQNDASLLSTSILPLLTSKDTDQNFANANSDDASSSFSSQDILALQQANGYRIAQDETQSLSPQPDEQLSSEDVDNTSSSDVETSLPEVPGETPTEETTPTADETASVPATSPESPLNAKTETPTINTSEQKSPIASDTRVRPTYTKRSGKILIDEWYALFDELYRQLPGYLPAFEVPRGTGNTDAILSLINAGATREQAAFVFKDICSDDDAFWLKHRTITAVKSQFPTRVPKMNVKQRGKNVSIQQQLQDKVPDFEVKSQSDLIMMMPDERKAYAKRLNEHLTAQREREQSQQQQVSA